MNDGPNKTTLEELSLLAALESVKAEVDTSVISEIQNWSGAVVGKFYGAEIEQPAQVTDRLSESLILASPDVAANIPVSIPQVAHGGLSYAQMTTSELIQICLFSRDEAAWTEFVCRFQPLIANAITNALKRGHRSMELLDDLVQDTFIKLCANDFRALKNFKIEGENAFLGFLKIVATHVAQDHFMVRYAASSPSSQYLAEKNAPSQSAKTNESSTDIEKNIQFKEIDDLLQTESHQPNFERDYKIFWLYYGEGLTAKKISELPDMGLNVKGVESVLLRMTQQIRQSLFPPASQKQSKKKPK